MENNVTQVFNNLKQKLGNLFDQIDKDKNENPEGKKGTIGAAKQAVSGFAVLAKQMFAHIEPTDPFYEMLKELEEKVDKMIAYNKLLSEEQKKDPNIKIEDILSAEEQREFEKISTSITYVPVENVKLPDVELFLENQAVPYVKAASTNENVNFIITDSKYAQILNQMRRTLGINQKYGLVGLEDFNKANDNPERMQVSNIDAWEAQLYHKLMQEARISGGMAYANDADINNLKCNIVYRPQDDAMMQLMTVKALLIKSASLNPYADMLLKNRLEGRLKDKILLSKAMEMSQFSNFYICSESVDKYVTLTKEGCALYVNGKLKESYSRADLSEKDFKEKFQELAYSVQNNNMVILQDKDLIPNREQILAEFNNFEARRKITSKKHSNIIDTNTLDPNMVETLKRLELTPLDDVIKQRLGRNELYVLKALEEYLRVNNAVIAQPISEMLSNTEGKPSFDMIICNTQEYAKLFAEYASLNTRLLTANENEQTKMIIREQLENLQEQLFAEQTALKDSIEAFRSTYDVPADILEQFIQGVSVNCGATIDTETGKVEFSTDPVEVQEIIEKAGRTSALLSQISEEIEVRKGHTNMGIGDNMSLANEKVVEDRVVEAEEMTK